MGGGRGKGEIHTHIHTHTHKPQAAPTRASWGGLKRAVRARPALFKAVHAFTSKEPWLARLAILALEEEPSGAEHVVALGHRVPCRRECQHKQRDKLNRPNKQHGLPKHNTRNESQPACLLACLTFYHTLSILGRCCELGFRWNRKEGTRMKTCWLAWSTSVRDRGQRSGFG